MTISNTKKRSYFLPDDVSADTKAILAQAMAAIPTADAEKITLRKYYEGDLRILDEIFQKPLAWTDADWQEVMLFRVNLNLTRATLKVLFSSVYGGTQFRQVQGPNSAENDFINAYLNGPDFSEAMKTRILGAYLYGTQVQIPEYNSENGFSILSLDPCATNFVRDFFGVPVGVVCFCCSGGSESLYQFLPYDNRFHFNGSYWDYARVFTMDGRGVVAKKSECSSWFEQPLKISPWAISRGNIKLDDKFTGFSLVRELPRVDANLAALYFNACLAVRSNAKKLIALMTDTDLREPQTEESGSFTMLTLPKDSKVESVDLKMESEPIMKSIDSLISIQSFFSGTPCTANAKSHQSATGAEMQNISLTSQVSMLAAQSQAEELETILRLLQAFRAGTGEKPMTRMELLKTYRPEIKITSALDTISELEKSQIVKNLRDAQAPEEDIENAVK